MTSPNTLVLVVNLGTPTSTSPQAVRSFLREFLSDRRVVDLPRYIWLPILYCFVLTFRSYRAAKAYESIWIRGAQVAQMTGKSASCGTSPLSLYTYSIAAKLQCTLEKCSVLVKAAMRYGEDNIPSCLAAVRRDYPGIRRVLVLPLFPQYSSTTTACVFDEVFSFYSDPTKRCLPSLHLNREYYRNTMYIEAIAESVVAKLGEHFHCGKEADWAQVLSTVLPHIAILCSYHSIPVRFAATGDDYPEQCYETTRLLQASLEKKLNLSLHNVIVHVFQSRFGKEPWIGPFLMETIQVLPLECDTDENRVRKRELANVSQRPFLAEKTVKTCFVVSPSFSVDCLETLEEIAIATREYFHESGGETFVYIPCLNDSDAHVSSLISVIEENIRV
ncbi:ferrochelatase [Strigomonas culicis]|uniref:Ferrochelatase n=1 Tax=Strigomonas culicis TaxID=28005 RepID=G1C9Q4_9TRYP|nr:ferrochelatase [Strigomonas culicis]EPY31135.1 ferrochelatase [Strigomonas culicis]EPY31705.1 ferrochelatase [Strigomonas culicis]|eukprot:EPY31135.1 ferrochelatase [Strigomonas culicis]